eukprot:TRINITY_DN3775_c0_g1_i1.p1 TRINITY_DN3775_c0_g1~~TRINITY_DN3775_c0_g1_i1.p1  ORF type:complete len:201 (+),score=40.45 TRINITY_DN3775_c0_g1_i1:103-705(+)
MATVASPATELASGLAILRASDWSCGASATHSSRTALEALLTAIPNVHRPVAQTDATPAHLIQTAMVVISTTPAQPATVVMSTPVIPRDSRKKQSPAKEQAACTPKKQSPPTKARKSPVERKPSPKTTAQRLVPTATDAISSGPATPVAASASAYAASAYSASPAPSALPLPSFGSRAPSVKMDAVQATSDLKRMLNIAL